MKYHTKLSILTIGLIWVLLTYTNPNSSNIIISQTTQNDANSGADAPDNVDDAIAVNNDTTYSGVVGILYTNTDGAADKNDFYKITLSSTGNFSLYFEITNPLLSPDTIVYIMKGSDIVGYEYIFTFESPFLLVVPIINADTYNIRISCPYSDNMTYSFTPIFYSGNIVEQEDGGSLGDSELSSPKEISLDTIFSGTIGNGAVNTSGLLDDIDYYNVSLPGEGYLDMSSNFSTMDDPLNPVYTVSVFKTDSRHIYDDNSNHFSDKNFSYSVPIATSGYYIVIIESVDWNSTYDIELSFRSEILPKQNDANSNDDASRDITEAPYVGVNNTFTGTIGQGLLDRYDGGGDDIDFYLLGSLDNGNLKIALKYLESTGSAGEIELYSEACVDWGGPCLHANKLNPDKQVTNEISARKSYYIELVAELRSLDRNISYEITIEFYNITSDSSSDSSSTTSSTSSTSISSSTSSSTTSSTSSSTTSSTSTTSTGSETSDDKSDGGNGANFPVSISYIMMCVIIPRIIRFKRRT